MNIEIAHPPNIDAIDAAFHVKNRHGILYTYGNTIYNPSGGKIPIWLEKHEEVHAERQYAYSCYGCNSGPEGWWEEYIASPSFRLEEELVAHQVEYQIYKLMHNRNYTRGHLVMMSERLSGSMYGKCVDKKTAKELIKDVETPEEEVQTEQPEIPEVETESL